MTTVLEIGMFAVFFGCGSKNAAWKDLKTMIEDMPVAMTTYDIKDLANFIARRTRPAAPRSREPQRLGRGLHPMPPLSNLMEN